MSAFFNFVFFSTPAEERYNCCVHNAIRHRRKDIRAQAHPRCCNASRGTFLTTQTCRVLCCQHRAHGIAGLRQRLILELVSVAGPSQRTSANMHRRCCCLEQPPRLCPASPPPTIWRFHPLPELRRPTVASAAPPQQATIYVLATTAIVARYDNVQLPASSILRPGAQAATVTATDGTSVQVFTGYGWTTEPRFASPFTGSVNAAAADTVTGRSTGRLQVVQIGFRACAANATTAAGTSG